MMKKIVALLMIIVLSCSVVYGQTEKEKIPSHYLMVMYANNQLYYDCIRSHKSISVGYNPMHKNKGFGLNAWYLQDDHTSYYGFKESMIIIQPSIHLLHKSLVVKLGWNVFILSEGEEPGLKTWQPAIEINYGFMENFYLSFNFKSDMFFGSVNANIHYVFNDNISGIMLGYAYKENWDDDYNGLIYKFDCMIFGKFLLRICGNVDFKFSPQGIQAGIGIFL